MAEANNTDDANRPVALETSGIVTRNSVADIWGERTPYVSEWPQRFDARTLENVQTWVQSACSYCSTGCALDIGITKGRIVGVRGRIHDRVNRGRLGPKGMYGWEANASKDRLRHPLVREKGQLQRASWDEAMELIVRRSSEVKEQYTAGAIGIYNSGQLLLEEYYTLTLMGTCGIGTPHLDGNTRLCTSTAALALIESFGTDGAPGSYHDFDLTDCFFLMGHNMAETQTVLWSRILDRCAGPKRPTLLVVDPRRTLTAQEADLHLAPRAGTNLPLMLGLLHLIIKANHLDAEFIKAHTIGFASLEKAVAPWPPGRAAEVTHVPQKDIEAAAEVLGTSSSLVSTVLQGVYQSLQATATAVQVNNLHLIRGMIGKPGCTVFQMNGQPTAQNTRECGANGEMVAFRNWNNPAHIAQQAKIWNVRSEDIPHATPPTHVMQIFRYAELGSIRFLWIIGTNPAVTLPELDRIRRVVEKKDLFVVVQDGFLSETAQLADVVLPAALWSEKTGCMTNADRTVHLVRKAVEPPGEAKSDFDIFIDYARRMDFHDKDGEVLIKWRTTEECFEAWKECSRGRPCDYSGLTYEKLSGESGIQWPCNNEFPQGRERLYTDGQFNTSIDFCELYGHDLTTGAPITKQQYQAQNPSGKAIIKAAEYRLPPESPDAQYPFLLTTGRVVYQWHTRTRTGRVKSLQDSAPEPFVQIASADATALGIADGDPVEVASRRGTIQVPARIGDIEPGHVFIPFHYGYWDSNEKKRAANELTLTGWDPISKQPHFKYAAVRISKAGVS